MNDHTSNPPPNDESGADSAWESAMSRDFDARVRDLHEAPLSLDQVKGKAVTIRRNRRITVAGSVLAVAAVITPVAVIASTGGGDADSRPPIATDPPDAASEPDYIADGVWHQADGDEVELAEDYYSAAVIWDGQLAAQRSRGGDVSRSVTEIVDADGDVVETFDSNQGIAVAEDGSVLAYIDGDGELVARWADGQVSMGTGLDINHSVAAVTGSGSCEEDTCSVYVNDGDGAPAVYSSDGTTATVVPDATSYSDASGGAAGVVTVTNEVTDSGTCGGLYSLETGEYLWQTCEFQVQQISPDGRYVAAPPAYLSGFGPPQIATLEAAVGPVDGEPAGRWAVDGATVVAWEWSLDGRLVFTAYDGASWHLYAMTPSNGAVEELTDPIEGGDMDNPFTLIGH